MNIDSCGNDAAKIDALYNIVYNKKQSKCYNCEDIMKEIIKKIRGFMGVSQQELSEYLNVSFATINRWENGHAIPARSAQNRLFEYCIENKVPLIDFIHEKIKTVSSELSYSADRLLLYHGSKSGLEGAIAPISRKHCDFGRGFYMGTQPDQPLTLVCDFPKSKFYLVSVGLDEIKSIEVPVDIEWAMLVAYHRGRMENIKGTAFYDNYQKLTREYDIIIGSIADDKMFQVLDDFFIGNITDVALTKSLAALELGKQYVAVTKKGCEAVKVEREIPLSYLEKRCFQVMAEENRTRGVALANDICRKNRRKGRYYDEILDEVLKG